MSESVVGFSVAATRQNAGSERGKSGRVGGGDGTSPGSPVVASVIVAFGSVSVDRCSHASASTRTETLRAAGINARHAAARILIFLLTLLVRHARRPLHTENSQPCDR